MRVLVTGGGGFLGLYVTEQLVARGDQVRVLCRGQYPRLDELQVETVRGDVRDAAAVAQACSGMDIVFHTAAVPGIWGPWEHYHSINTVGTQHVLDACLASGVRKLIYTSSPSVIYDGLDHHGIDETQPYPTSYLCHYPHSKAIAERAVLAANGQDGLATAALRPHLIWGPRDNHLVPRLIERARSGRLRRVGDGKNLISMSYVENAARAHLQAADRLELGSPVAGQAYFINEPEPVNLWSWVDEILTLAGERPLKKRISASAAYAIGATCEAAYTVLRMKSEPPMTRFLALQLGGTHYYSVAKAQRDFGYQPQVSIAEGMRRMAADWKSRGSV
ncbi:MAG: NAD-dependent epimerase/dehydratase family protein [Planctomycetota bacterium]